jgi:hypothetical protein
MANSNLISNSGGSSEDQNANKNVYAHEVSDDKDYL